VVAPLAILETLGVLVPLATPHQGLAWLLPPLLPEIDDRHPPAPCPARRSVTMIQIDPLFSLVLNETTGQLMLVLAPGVRVQKEVHTWILYTPTNEVFIDFTCTLHELLEPLYPHETVMSLECQQ